MPMIHPVDTFVIRLWSPADPAADTGDAPHGIARHVGTGRAGAFRDGDELIALLRELPRGATTDHEYTPDPSGAEPA
jgi:2-polyprenyl-6-methoxyphenol hydroxylase-like FAD-dependent oxidoreductase